MVELRSAIICSAKCLNCSIVIRPHDNGAFNVNIHMMDLCSRSGHGTYFGRRKVSAARTGEGKRTAASCSVPADIPNPKVDASASAAKMDQGEQGAPDIIGIS